MTEPIFPDRLADELLTGAADPSTLSADVRGVAEVLAAAQQAPSSDELAGMSAAVAAFQGIVASPASAPAGSAPSRRASRMFSTRIPKRAAAIVAATVLCAGTAAAAAGGALPSPFGGESRTEDVVGGTDSSSSAPETTTGGSDTTAAPDTTTGATDTTTGDTAVETTTAGTTDDTTGDTTGDTTESTVYPGRDYGLCTAWTHGAAKPLNPAFQYLADQAADDASAGADPQAPSTSADEAAVRAGVDAYCEKVIADKKGDDATDDDTDATEVDDTEVENTVDGTQPSHGKPDHAGKPDDAGKPAQPGNGHGKAGEHGKP